ALLRRPRRRAHRAARSSGEARQRHPLCSDRLSLCRSNDPSRLRSEGSAMSDAALTKTRLELATDYFRKVDSGDPSLVDSMTDDVEFYFPKFGVGRGKAAFAELAKGLLASLRSIQHDLERMRFHVAGDHVIIEGVESGVLADGTRWPVEGRSEGRFANVFERKSV